MLNSLGAIGRKPSVSVALGAIMLIAYSVILLRDSVLWIPSLVVIVAAWCIVYRSKSASNTHLHFVAAIFLPLFFALVAYLTKDDFLANHLIFAGLISIVIVVIFRSNKPAFLLGAGVALPLLAIATIEIGPKVANRLAPQAVLGETLVMRETAMIDTHFGLLRVTEYRAPVVESSGIYTSLARFGDDVIWADAHGRFYLFDSDNTFRQLDILLDINTAQFIGDAKPGLQLNRFSVKDIAVNDGRLYISHHYWHEAGGCYTIRVSSLPIDRATIDNDAWTTPEMLFESQPCIPVDAQTSDGQLMEAGGKLAFLDDALLLTLGDNMFDGRQLSNETNRSGERRAIFSQDSNVDYGKTLIINTLSGNAEVYSLGHRNPQGLFVDENNSILLTEHGPKGGDELNIVTQGANYGWPLVTYGTQYNDYSWELNEVNGEHFGFEGPSYSWAPSIGISALARLETGVFAEWKDDIIITSLRARSLFRVRIRDDRVVMVEPVEIGFPVRDIVEMEGGRIVLSTTNSSILIVDTLETDSGTQTLSASIEDRLSMADISIGADLYEGQCAACHADDGQGAGPTLVGMFSAGARADNGFIYSSAFSEMQPEWTNTLLDEWLASPAALILNTTMVYQGMADPRDRAHLIAYLADKY